MKRIFLAVLLFSGFLSSLEALSCTSDWRKGESFYNAAAQKKLKPYLMPDNHRMKSVLDEIFQSPRPLADEDSFINAGFTILLTKRAGQTKNAYWRLARHPQVPGYLFKVYLDSETTLKKNEGWRKLADRCRGAANIRKLIQEKGLHHFVVPEKWLYRVPADGLTANQQPVILMVTDMDLASGKACKKAWKHATKEQLNELYCIFSHGYGSTFILGNVCLTRNGKFACVDTECPKRKLDLNKVRHVLSEEMQDYWDHLVRTKGKKLKFRHSEFISAEKQIK